ncbi:hypothetical protein AcV7_004784 [Taiwanofungus camphoratus]|nr:hypothetical protein AcV7_004784 [Antrodia cinnamomea]
MIQSKSMGLTTMLPIAELINTTINLLKRCSGHGYRRPAILSVAVSTTMTRSGVDCSLRYKLLYHLPLVEIVDTQHTSLQRVCKLKKAGTWEESLHRIVVHHQGNTGEITGDDHTEST